MFTISVSAMKIVNFSNPIVNVGYNQNFYVKGAVVASDISDTVSISDVAKSFYEASKQSGKDLKESSYQINSDAGMGNENKPEMDDYQAFYNEQTAVLAEYLGVDDTEMLKQATNEDISEYYSIFLSDYSDKRPKVAEGIESAADFWKAKFETDSEGNFIKNSDGKYIHKTDSALVDGSVWVDKVTGEETRYSFTDSNGEPLSVLSPTVSKTIGETNAGALMLLNEGLKSGNKNIIGYGIQQINSGNKYDSGADNEKLKFSDFIDKKVGFFAASDSVFRQMTESNESATYYTFFNKFIELLKGQT